MSGKKKTNETAKKVGFYVALAICLVAVGVAAWSTYDAVQTYDGVDEVGEFYTPSEDIQPVINTESTAGDEDGEALVSGDKNSLKVTESKPAQETAGEVIQNVESEESSDVFIPQEQEQGVPVNAGTIYEVSEVMHYPVDSKEIIGHYSSGVPVYSETMRDWRIHCGADIKAESGEDVKACANGVVKEVTTDAMLGNIAVIEHGEYIFWYCGLGETFEIAQGDTVSAGQKIGTVAAVPYEAADESHIHLEVKRDDIYINPVDIMTKE